MPSPDYRPALTAAYAQASDVVSGVRADQLGAPTPCPDYNVAQLIDHLVGAARRTAALGRGEQVEVSEFPHVELADAPDQLRRAAREAQAAWADDARLGDTVTMPWGESYTGQTIVEMYVAELATHAWDLARATGQLDRLEPELAETALGAARAMLRPEFRDAVGPGSPFGPEVAAPAQAGPWERLAAFMGRQPAG